MFEGKTEQFHKIMSAGDIESSAVEFSENI